MHYLCSYVLFLCKRSPASPKMHNLKRKIFISIYCMSLSALFKSAHLGGLAVNFVFVNASSTKINQSSIGTVMIEGDTVTFVCKSSG